MTTPKDYRRANIRKLAESVGGVTELAKKLGYANSSFIVQMCGPRPIRQVSESTARRFEQLLDLVPGSLDTPVDLTTEDVVSPDAVHVRQVNYYRKRKGLDLLSTEPVAPGPAVMTREQLASIVSMVGKVCDEAQANIPTSKFADIIALTLLANDDQKAGSSEDYVRLLVSLTK